MDDGVTDEGTFGTSFATPRVAGQMVNSFYNMNPDYADFMEIILHTIKRFKFGLTLMPTEYLTTLVDNMVVTTAERMCLGISKIRKRSVCYAYLTENGSYFAEHKGLQDYLIDDVQILQNLMIYHIKRI